MKSIETPRELRRANELYANMVYFGEHVTDILGNACHINHVLVTYTWSNVSEFCPHTVAEVIRENPDKIFHSYLANGKTCLDVCI